MIVLFHDYTSPASAVAVARLQRLIAEGAVAEIRGTEVSGIDAVLPVTVDLLAELEAVASAATAEGLTLRRPALLPPTGLAHVVEDVAVAHGRGQAWREHCYRGYWAEGRNIADPAMLERLAQDAELPAEQVASALNDRLALLTVRRRSAGYRHEGIGGVPTISYNRTLVPGLLAEDDLRTLAALAPGTG
jgi:predicted DsbA family dithiol-disulfide isomerase